MATKKTTTSSATETKARKPAAKKAAPMKAAAAVEMKAEAPSREEIAYLAHRYWSERGRPEGSAEMDWMRAERELAGSHV